MAKIAHDTVRVDASALLTACQAVLVAHAVPAKEAEYVAWHLVETNLRGTDSHGVARLPHYVRRLESGSIKSRPHFQRDRRAAALGLIDGDQGLGHLVMKEAADFAAELADETGAGWVAVKNSSHCGALAPFGLRLAERGCIGLVFSHVDPMVLPHGSRAPFCGTNPICLTAPGTGGRALCLDMATSVVPWNLVANAATEGVPIPKGWAVDKEGHDTEDPRHVHALYPFGQHKGSGLGLLIDVFCSLLSQTPYGPDIPKMYGDLTQPRELGGLVGAIKIAPFVGLPDFQERVAQIMERLAGLPPVDPASRVQFPGEPELETQAHRRRDGIPIGINVLAELNELACTSGIPPIPSLTP